MKRPIGPLTVLGAALVLFGCSGEAPEDGETAPAEQTKPAIAEPFAQPLTAMEGNAELTPLATGAGAKSGLGEEGCRFAYMDRTLLVTGEGKAIAILDGRIVTLPGEDLEFSRGDTAFRIERAEGSPETVDGGRRWPADLVVEDSSGETKFSPGTWTCAS